MLGLTGHPRADPEGRDVAERQTASEFSVTSGSMELNHLEGESMTSQTSSADPLESMLAARLNRRNVLKSAAAAGMLLPALGISTGVRAASGTAVGSPIAVPLTVPTTTPDANA